jgi:type II secretory pathway pseudopilin PulG
MKQSSNGQILLIVLFVAAILLTVGLAMTSQTITDVNLTSQQQENLRAFNATEAGIEDLLGRDLQSVIQTNPNCLDADSACDQLTTGSSALDYKYYIKSSGTKAFEVPDPIENGGVYQLALAGYTGSNITVAWSGSSTGIEAIFVYDDPGVPSVVVTKQRAFNGTYAGDTPCFKLPYGPAASYINDSGFSGNYDLQYSFDVQYINGTSPIPPSYVRIRPLCAAQTNLAFKPEGSNLFPAQTYTAHVESKSGENVSAVEAGQSAFKVLPGIFDMVLYSGQDIIYND